MIFFTSFSFSSRIFWARSRTMVPCGGSVSSSGGGAGGRPLSFWSFSRSTESSFATSRRRRSFATALMPPVCMAFAGLCGGDESIAGRIVRSASAWRSRFFRSSAAETTALAHHRARLEGKSGGHDPAATDGLRWILRRVENLEPQGLHETLSRLRARAKLLSSRRH